MDEEPNDMNSNTDNKNPPIQEQNKKIEEEGNQDTKKIESVQEHTPFVLLVHDAEIIRSRPEDDSSSLVNPQSPIKSIEDQVKPQPIVQSIPQPQAKLEVKQIEPISKLDPEPISMPISNSIPEQNRKESSTEEIRTDENEQYKKVEQLAKEYQQTISEKVSSTAENFNIFISNLKKNFDAEKEEDKQNRKKRNQKMKKIDQVLSLASVLRRSIETNFDLLNLILLYSGSDILNIKQFVGENIDKILDSWLITHMDSDQLSNIKQSNKTPQNIKNYIFQDLKKALKHLKINGAHEIDPEEIKKINKSNVQKLTVNHINPEMFGRLFHMDSNSEEFSQLSKVNIKDCNLENINITHYFSEIDRLSIQTCKISFSGIDKLKLQRLTELSLSKINMTNNTWALFKKGLLANKYLMHNLESLSLANNKLSSFSLYDEKIKALFDNLEPDQQNTSNKQIKSKANESIQQQSNNEDLTKKEPQGSSNQPSKKKFPFPNLKTIDLENNKLSKFLIENYNMVESLHVLNLVSNNFSFMDNLVGLQRQTKRENGEKTPQTLVLLQKNNYLFKPEKRQEYLDSLLPTLKDFNYIVKSLTFDYSFYLNNKAALNELVFSGKIQESLKVLNMSSCSLRNAEIIKIIKDHKFDKLSKLDISFNFIDDNLFKESRLESNANINAPSIEGIVPPEAIEPKCIFEKLVKLEELNLSGNKIRGEVESISTIKEFLKNNLSLKKVLFYNTPLEELFGSLMKEIKKREKKNTPVELLENKEKNKDKSTEEQLLKILTQSVQNLEQKDFTNKNAFNLFDFIKGINSYNSQLKLYFKNTYSSSTAKRFKIIFKNIRLKKLSDRDFVYLPQ